MKFKWVYYIVGVIGIGIIGRADSAEPMFQVSYDNNFAAAKAGGDETGDPGILVDYESLNYLLKQGLQGKALQAGVSTDGKKKYFCKYNATNNIAKESGTVTFWLKPQNWDGKNNKPGRNFFSASGQKSILLIYKFPGAKNMFFLLGPNEKDDNQNWKYTIAEANISDWKVGQWHFICASWNKELLKLYIDGELKSAINLKSPCPNPFETITVGSLSWPNEEGETLVDELKIYSEPVNGQIIKDEWEKQRTKIDNNDRPLITLGRSPAAVDGQIRQGEYAFASTGFYNILGRYANTQSKYFLSYDDKNLYVGMSSPVPDEGLKSDAAVRDSAVWEDDSIEIYINPEINKGISYHFIFNSKGVLYDAMNDNAVWNAPDFPVVNKINDKNWIFEAAIPLDILGLKNPVNKSCLINICRSFAKYKKWTCSSPCRGSYNDVKSFSEITFSPKSFQLDIESLGELGNGNADVCITLKSMERDKATVKLDLSANKSSVATLNQSYEVGAGKDIKVEMKKDKFSRNGNFKAELSLDSVGNVYKGDFSFCRIIPFEVSFIYTKIKDRIMNIAVRHLQEPLPGEFIMVTFFDSKESKVLQKKQNPGGLSYQIPVDISKLPPGPYTIKTSYLNSIGDTLFEYIQPFNNPDSKPVWENNNIGISDRVPPPWTPMKVTGSAVSCWGHNYIFNRSILPEQITTHGKDMLAGPVSLKLIRQGKEYFPEKSSNRILMAKDTEVSMEGCAELNGFKLKSSIKIEFDSFIWVDLEIIPNHGDMAIDELYLEIPLKKEYATLVHNCIKNYDKMNKGANTKTGFLPANGWQKNFFDKPAFWIGNDSAGIEVAAEEFRDWAVKDQGKSAEIVTDENSATIKLKIVDHHIQVNAKKKISFAIQATPVKAPVKNWRAERVTKTFNPWYISWTNYLNDPDPELIDFKDIKKTFEEHKKINVKVLPYLAGYGTSPLTPDWIFWSENWAATPPPLGTSIWEVPDPDGNEIIKRQYVYAYVCLNSNSYRDFYLWKLNESMKKLDSQGVKLKDLYFDLAVPRLCNNAEHGCGWKSSNGELNSSYNLRGTREFFKRIYTLMRENNPECLIMHHMTEEPITGVLAFSDILADGENYVVEVAKQENYYDILTPGLFRAAFTGHQWGTPSYYIPQFYRSMDICGKRHRMSFWKTQEANKPINHFLGYLMVHDAKDWSVYPVLHPDRLNKVWQLQDYLGWNDNVQFLPYWQKDNPVKLKFPLSDRIMVSSYKNGNKVLIAALNDTDKNIEAVISVDFKDLFQNKTTGFKAVNPFEKVKYQLNDSELKIELPAREFREIIIE